MCLAWKVERVNQYGIHLQSLVQLVSSASCLLERDFFLTQSIDQQEQRCNCNRELLSRKIEHFDITVDRD